jgi:CDP-4-dehydro-6-deoxyglucose reductase
MNSNPAKLQAQFRTVTVQFIDELSAQVIRLGLQHSDGAAHRYKEGQYLSLMLPDGTVRSYSYASADNKEGRFELHIRIHAKGRFSQQLRKEMKPGDVIRALGPFGDCIWHQADPSDRTVLMLATGTGIAPLKAMLDALLQAGRRPRLSLYWGGATEDDIYLMQYFRQLEATYSGIRFIPVLSAPSEMWNGQRGFVQDIARLDHPDLSAARVYACGSPAMVDSARFVFIQKCGLDPAAFLADAFEATSAQPPATVAGQQLVEVPVASQDGVRVVLPLPKGGSLMEGLRQAGMLQGVCGGRQSCGTCRISLDPGDFERLGSLKRGEQRLLQALPESGPFDRLACQIPIDENISQMQIQLARMAF